DGSLGSPAEYASRFPGALARYVTWRSPATIVSTPPSNTLARITCASPRTAKIAVTVRPSGDHAGPGVIAGGGKSTTPWSYRFVMHRAAPLSTFTIHGRTMGSPIHGVGSSSA